MPRRACICVFIYIILWLSLSSDLHGQSATVRGFVTDQYDGQTLQSVNVLLEQYGSFYSGTATDTDGFYVLSGLRPGRYVLRASYVGYTIYMENFELDAGQILTRNIVLVQGDAALDEVVVEAERSVGAVAIAAGLQKIRTADIDRVPTPGASTDLVGYIQTMPGMVNVGDRGGQLFIRGGTATQNATTIDGIPVYQPFHIVGFYSAFPSEILNSVDLYSGGYGARYGGWMSSVIDVATRNGNKQRFTASASLATFMSTARVEGPLVKRKVSVLAMVRESLFEQIMPEMLGQRMPYRFGDQFAKLHALLTPTLSFSATALRTRDRGDVAGTKKTFLGDFQASAPSDSSRVGWGNEAYGGRLLFTPVRVPILAELQFSRSQMSGFFGPKEIRERESSVDSRNLSLNLTYFTRELALRFGIFSRQTEFKYQLKNLFIDPHIVMQQKDPAPHRLTEGGAYFETELDTRLGIRLDPGLRLHGYRNMERIYAEPRLRVVWDLGRREAQISAAWGIYHQGITGLMDQRDAGSAFTAWTSVPEDTPIPRAQHYILGGRARIDSTLIVSVEGFHKQLYDLSVPVWRPFPQYTTALQHADGIVWGLDARVEVEQPFIYDSQLYFYAGYGLSFVKHDTGRQSYFPPHDRRHQLHLLARMHWGNISLTARWEYGSGLPYTQSAGFDIWIPMIGSEVDVRSDPGRVRVLYNEPYGGRLPAYHRLDLWLEKTVERDRYRGALQVGAINVYNRENIFYFDLWTLNRIDQLPFIPSVGFKMELQ